MAGGSIGTYCVSLMPGLGTAPLPRPRYKCYVHVGILGVS